LLLAREGVPVLMHGVVTDPGRVTSAEILRVMELPPVTGREQVAPQFAAGLPVFIPIEQLAPRMARLLAMRRILGVRNSTHTLVKLIQPFSQPALRLNSYTHPEYLTMLTTYFSSAAPAGRGDVFLMRGTEGETVANVKRAQQIEWFHHHTCTTLVHRQEPVDALPALPEGADAESTAIWIRAVLDGQQAIPEAIAEQVTHCMRVAKQLRNIAQ